MGFSEKCAEFDKCPVANEHWCWKKNCFTTRGTTTESATPAGQAELVGYKTHAVAMAQAIQKFKNLEMLGKLVELRGTQEYDDLCQAWKRFDDYTIRKLRGL
jgi:hypothetical protein